MCSLESYLSNKPKTVPLTFLNFSTTFAQCVRLFERSLQLSEWTENPNEIPKVTWLSGLIIPESFLTAIKQVTAQQKSLELDKLVTWTEWSKKMDAAAIEGQPRTGAYMSGFYMQGAR